MRTVHTATSPQHAPEDFRSLPAQVVTKDGGALFGAWHGSGVRTGRACGVCANTEGNLQIYSNWGYSYPNGNSWDDAEIVCGKCGQFTTEMEFREG